MYDLSTIDDLRTALRESEAHDRAVIDVRAVRDRAFRLRRRRRLAAGGCLAVAALAVAGLVPLVQGGAPDEVATAPADDPYLGAPRGSLAGDDAFVAAVARVDWLLPSGATQPPVSERHVVFAGEVPGGRWARVIAPFGGDWMGVWLTGPVDASAEQLTQTDQADSDVGAAQVRADFSDPAAPLVVIGLPGDAVEISERTVIAADGTPERSYVPVDTVDGVAVTSVPDGFAAGFDVRVLRDGQPVYWTGGIQDSTTGSTWTDADVLATTSRARGEPDLDLVRSTVTRLDVTGVPPAELDPDVLWGGPLDPIEPDGLQASVVIAELPSGAIAILGGWGVATPAGGTAGLCMLELLPAGSAYEDRLVAMRCDVQPTDQSAATVPYLVLVAPPTAVAVRVMAADQELREVVLTDGVAILDHPDGANRFVAITADGATIADVPLASVTDIRLTGDLPPP